MVDKRVNKFSIFKTPEHNTFIVGAGDTSNFGDQPELIAAAGTAPSYNPSRSIVRAQVIKGTLDPVKIPNFDKISGLRVHLYVLKRTSSPEVTMHELNDALTKYFQQGDGTTGCTWLYYRDLESDGTPSGVLGCPWKTSGGDFDDENCLAHRLCNVSSTWKEFEIDDWTNDQDFTDSACVSLMVKEKEGQNNDLLQFNSTRTASTGALNTSCWRGDEFGGGNVYFNGKHTATGLVPLFEFVYSDEVPDPITDFRMVTKEEDPEKVFFEWSEVSDEDIQGYMAFATTDPKTYDFATDQFGWVDSVSTSADAITCGGQAPNWAVDQWNTYKLIMTNGVARGNEYTINDTGNTDGELTLNSSTSATLFPYNSMFIPVKGAKSDTDIYSIKTNKGYFNPKAPQDDDFIHIDDYTNAFTENTKYFVFVQAMDNLSIGPRGDKSNYFEFVKPKIDNGNLKIRSKTDNAEGVNIDVFEEVYVDCYAKGGQNTVDNLKGINGMQVKTDLHTYVLDTFTTTLSGAWGAGTTITLDLDEIPQKYFRSGQQVVVTDGTNADFRTIEAVGDNTIKVDSGPNSSFAATTTIAYPATTWIYTETGAKTVKGRALNEDGFFSGWSTPTTPPNPTSISGVAGLRVGPPDIEKNTTEVTFNMSEFLVKPSNYTIQNYFLDKDNTGGLTSYTKPLQSYTYASDGAKNTFAYVDDDDGIVTPSFTDITQRLGGAFSDATVSLRDNDAGTNFALLNNVGDAGFWGRSRQFSGFFASLSAAFTGYNLAWHYYNNTPSWAALTVVDDTASFSANGTVTFTAPTDWATTTVDDSASLYFIRARVDSKNAGGFFNHCVPMELGNNYTILTVEDPVTVDLDDTTNVLKNGYTLSNTTFEKRMYVQEGILATLTKKGIDKIPIMSMSGSAWEASSNLLSGYDVNNKPVFSGAANTLEIPDDIQVLYDIVDNGRIVQKIDKFGITRKGYLRNTSLPQMAPGMPRYDWSVTFVIDPNRS